MTDATGLWQFVEEQLNERDMSLRTFAQMIGVTHSTLLRFRDNPAALPSITILGRLAAGTHTDVCALIALIYPELTRHDTRALILAGRIEQLSPASQNVIDTLIAGELFKRKQHPGNQL